MANSLKRIEKSRDKQFQDRCLYYMYEQADIIFEQTAPDADDLLLAKALWAGQVKSEDMARIVMTNTTVGGKIDTDTDVPDSDIEYTVKTDNKFHDLALAYKSAGLIGV